MGKHVQLPRIVVTKYSDLGDDFEDRIKVFLIMMATSPIWSALVLATFFVLWLLVGVTLLLTWLVMLTLPFGYLLDDGYVIRIDKDK